MSAELETAPNKDAELRAMLAVVKYLEPLDRGARRRVLKWAEDRFVMEEMPDFGDPKLLAGFTDFVKAVAEAARQMGNVSPEQIIRAALKLDLLGAENAAPDG